MEVSNNQVLLFDMDGVLIDTRTAVEGFWNRIADANGVTLTPEEIERDIIGCKASLTLERLFPQLKQQDIEFVFEQMEKSERHQTYVEIPGAIEFIKLAKTAGFQIGLVTSAEPFKVHEVVRQLELDGIFDRIVTSRDVIHGKPAPDCYLAAAHEFSQDGLDCVVFEDSISGVQSAVAAGSMCIGISSNSDLLMKNGARHVFTDFNDGQLRQLFGFRKSPSASI